MILLVVILVCLQRLWELQIASSNVAHLRRKGAVEYGAEHYPFMVLLHAFWLLSTLLEWWFLEASVSRELVWAAWIFLLLGQALRWYAIRTLGRRWTTRILVLPGLPLVDGGLFRWIRHPNYLGVIFEIFALPLIGGCWRTSIIFGVLNLLLLRFRIATEETALSEGLSLFESKESPSS